MLSLKNTIIIITLLLFIASCRENQHTDSVSDSLKRLEAMTDNEIVEDYLKKRCDSIPLVCPFNTDTLNKIEYLKHKNLIKDDSVFFEKHAKNYLIKKKLLYDENYAIYEGHPLSSSFHFRGYTYLNKKLFLIYEESSLKYGSRIFLFSLNRNLEITSHVIIHGFGHSNDFNPFSRGKYFSSKIDCEGNILRTIYDTYIEEENPVSDVTIDSFNILGDGKIKFLAERKYKAIIVFDMLNNKPCEIKRVE
jgi:hypothetical protein